MKSNKEKERIKIVKNIKEMTVDELVELYKTEKNGEIKDLALIEILNKMEGYIRSVLARTNRFLLQPTYYEDVIQDCKIAVLEQLKTYDPNIGTSFITYCYLPIQQKTHVFITKNIYKNNSYNQKKYGKVEFSSLDNKLDLFLSSKRFEEDSIRKLEILDLLDNLNEINRFILIQFYINQESIKNISKKLGITEKAVKNRKEDSLEKLRKLV